MIKIHFINGPEKGHTIEVDAEMIYVGRSPENDVQVRDKSVSRRHIQIKNTEKDKTFLIKDLKSTNRTFIKGKPIKSNVEFEVEEGVPIAIGNIFFSLNIAYTGDALAVQESMGVATELGETGLLDRPMTSPKNLEIIYKVSSVLMQSLNINATLEKILDYIFELLQRIDRGAIVLLENDTGKIADVITRSTDTGNKTTMIYSRSIVNKVIKEGKAIIMTDTLEQDDVDRSESMELMKVRSVMCVPLISRSQTRGVIYVDSLNRPYGFRTEDLSLLTALSSPAAVAIENALLYSNSEKIIEARTKSLKETEEKLRESEARFKAIFNNMSSGVVVYEVKEDGNDFRILDLNKADRKIEGITKKEAIGKSLLEIFHEMKDTGLVETFKRVWETGKPERKPLSIGRGDKDRSYREYYIYRLPSGEVVSIFDDVTDKKKAEAEQKALQEQLFVAQKMESIGAFAGGTAHNFRNILQAISGNIEYLEMVHGENQEVKELSKSIYGSVKKGVDLINNLLHFSRRGGTYQLKELDLNDVIIDAYEIIEKVFNKNIEVKLIIDKDLFVKGNRSLLSQVFMNLFTNARDAMPDGGKLIIESRKSKGEVISTVTDTGHGMDKITIDKIFDPFFTLKDVGKGTGLGLSTSHGIIEQHKGSISASSKPGKGTTFKINIPLIEIDQLPKSESKKKIILGGGQKVLIVDDEVPVLETLVYLANKLGYNAIPLNSSTDVLDSYIKHAPEIVLMDRSMPEKDGAACIKEIKEHDPSAKIIIVSGYDETGPDGIDGETKELIEDYLTKPCGMEELGRKLAQVLEK